MARVSAKNKMFKFIAREIFETAEILYDYHKEVKNGGYTDAYLKANRDYYRRRELSLKHLFRAYIETFAIYDYMEELNNLRWTELEDFNDVYEMEFTKIFNEIRKDYETYTALHEED